MKPETFRTLAAIGSGLLVSFLPTQLALGIIATLVTYLGIGLGLNEPRRTK